MSVSRLDKPGALIGATGGRSYAHALAHGYQPAMIVMAGLCVAAAARHRTGRHRWPRGRPQIVPQEPEAGSASPVPDLATSTYDIDGGQQLISTG